MPARPKPSAYRLSTPATTSPSTSPDATRLLAADHREMRQLFDQYQALLKAKADDDPRQMLAERICMRLTVHTMIEEEIFYPAVRDALGEDNLIDEACVEHATAKDLIVQIQGMDASDDLYDAKVTVLGEYIQHHVKEEERQLFPRLRKAGADLKSIGHDLSMRREQLIARMRENSFAKQITH